MVAHCSRYADREGLVEEAVSSVLTTLDVGEVIERTGALLREHFGGTRVGLHRWRPEEPDLVEVLLVSDLRYPTPGPGTRFPFERSISGEAIRTREAVTVERIGEQPPRYREEEELARYGYGAAASFPLLAGERVLGTLDIAHLPQEGMLCRCFQPAQLISKLVGIALHNSLMVSEVRHLNRLLDRENTRLREELGQSRGGWRYVAESPAMRAVMEQVRLVAPSETTVLIRGETGTGKEGIARLIHENSRRRDGALVTVNLGAIPDSLIESELFGHERGAFTGAVRRKTGCFEQADGGTLFLDEVGDAPPAVQVKLLRALQERRIQRVGGERSISVDVRVVAATNRPLEQLADEGLFRADLYYRLNIFPIVLPPLRARRDDIRPLTEYLLERCAARLNRPTPRVPEAAWGALEGHDWPGNVRELENTLERALILSPVGRLVLPEPLGGELATASSVALSPPIRDDVPRFDDAVRELLERALASTSGRIYGPNGAAALLGLKPTTLQGKLKRYGIK